MASSGKLSMGSIDPALSEASIATRRAAGLRTNAPNVASFGSGFSPRAAVKPESEAESRVDMSQSPANLGSWNRSDHKYPNDRLQQAHLSSRLSLLRLLDQTCNRRRHLRAVRSEERRV